MQMEISILCTLERASVCTLNPEWPLVRVDTRASGWAIRSLKTDPLVLAFLPKAFPLGMGGVLRVSGRARRMSIFACRVCTGIARGRETESAPTRLTRVHSGVCVFKCLCVS